MSFLRYDQLPSLVTVPDDALIAVWSGGKLYAALKSSIGAGGGGGGHVIESNGSPLAQRSDLNVTGLLQATDAGGKTVLNLPNINLSSQVTAALGFANGGTGLTSLGTALQSLRVNAGVTGLEWYTPSAGLNAPAGGDNGKVAIASASNLIYALLTTANISPTAGVALTQLASVATDRLLGRDTAGSGTPEELTVGGGVEFTGSGGIQRSALTGAVSAAAGSGTTAFASGAFGALPVTTSGYFGLGTTPAASGGIRSDQSFSWETRSNIAGDLRIMRWGNGAINGLDFGDGSNSFTSIAGGLVNLVIGATARFAIAATSAVISVPSFLFNNTGLSNPVFGQTDFANATGTGDTFTTHAQDNPGAGAGTCTGGSRVDRAGNATGAATTTNGGNYDMQPGGGTTVGGALALRTGNKAGLGTKRIEINDTGIGFFNTAPVAKPSITGSRALSDAVSLSVLAAGVALGLWTDNTTP